MKKRKRKSREKNNRKQVNQKYYKKNQEGLLEKQKEYDQENKERIKKYKKEC